MAGANFYGETKAEYEGMTISVASHEENSERPSRVSIMTTDETTSAFVCLSLDQARAFMADLAKAIESAQ